MQKTALQQDIISLTNGCVQAVTAVAVMVGYVVLYCLVTIVCVAILTVLGVLLIGEKIVEVALRLIGGAGR